MRLLTIFLLTLFLLPSLASVAQVRADSYTPGPVFNLSNGHKLTVQFDGFSSAAVSNLTADLNQYVPKLLQAFYEPSVDYTVTIQYQNGGCNEGKYPACAGSGAITLGGAWGSPSYSLDDLSGLVHEFTHTLQFAPNGPASVLRDDAFLLYVEPTAEAMAAILSPVHGVDGNYYWDFAFDEPNVGVAAAATAYRLDQGGEPHAFPIYGWLALYRADQKIFKEMNNKLSQLSVQGYYGITIPELRQVIRESASVQTLNGLPIKQWLAAEGFLAKDEVPSYLNMADLRPIYPNQITVEWAIDPNGQSIAKIYNAITRGFLGESEYQFSGSRSSSSGGVDLPDLQKCMQVNSPLSSPYQCKTNMSTRADVQTSINGAVYERSFLLPPHLTPLENPDFLTNTENAVLLATSDGWLQPVNGTAIVNGQPWPIVNGVLRFTSTSPTVNVDLPDGRRIENFVTSGAVMVLGLNLTAFQLMHDTDQIRPTTAVQSTSAQPGQTATPPPPPATPRCIIATAAYGSEMAPEVVYMRYVRDRVVGSTPVGKVLRDGFNIWYYSWSPPIAVFISDKPWLRAIFRILLVPVSASVRAADLTFNAIGGGNFGSVIAFLFAATISILAYVALPILAIRLAWKHRDWPKILIRPE